MCLFREVNVKQVSMNGDLKAKERYKLFPHLCRYVFIFEPFSI